MGETVVVNMGEVQEKNPLLPAVYTFTFKDSKAFLVKSKKEGSDWIGLQGTLIPEGHPDDAFVVWLAANHSMDGVDVKKFFKGLGFPTEGPTAARIGGELATPEQIKAGSAPQAQVSLEGRQPIPVGFLKFKAKTQLEAGKDGRRRPRLEAILGRVE